MQHWLYALQMGAAALSLLASAATLTDAAVKARKERRAAKPSTEPDVR